MAQEKTEEPTPKKLRDARKRGEVARSREVNTAAVLLAAAGAFAAAGEHLLGKLTATFQLVFAAIAGHVAGAPPAILEAAALLGLQGVLPVLVAVLVAGTGAAYLQVGSMLAFDAVAPKPERLDPVKGLRNVFSQRQLVELFKTLLKMAVVGTVAWLTFRDGVRGIAGLPARDAEAALGAGSSLALALVLRVGGAMGLLAVLDLLYQRWRFRQDQKMTKEEVRREHRETEGDPHAKQHRERVHREILEHATLEEVRRADVLVINPTHLAVALRYDQEEHEAPEVIAKGRDHLARRMIEVAHQEGVPVMRDVPLARALTDLEIGEEIPEVLYEAVAAVLRAAWVEREEAERRGGGGERRE